MNKSYTNIGKRTPDNAGTPAKKYQKKGWVPYKLPLPTKCEWREGSNGECRRVQFGECSRMFNFEREDHAFVLTLNHVEMEIPENWYRPDAEHDTI